MSREIVTVVILGLVVGLQASLLAVGLVLIYQAQRFINFAQAQIGLVAASAFGVLVLHHDVPYVIGLVVAIAVGVGTAVAIERVISWRLREASPTTLVIASIGFSQLLLIAIETGPLAMDPARVSTRGYPVPFDLHLDVGGYTLSTSEIITVAVAPALVMALHLFVTRTRLGTSIRGVASNREAAVLAGISLRRTGVTVWVLAGLVSTVAGILMAPSRAPGTLSSAGTALLLPGLAAALAGALSDYRRALAAGVAVGVVQQAVLFWVHIPGFSDVAVFGFLIAMLILRSRTRTLGHEAVATLGRARTGANRLRRRAGFAGWGGLGAVLVALPLVPGLHTQEKALLLTLIVAYAMAGLSLLVLTGWAGQVSLGHFALVGVGAFVAARLFATGLSAPIVLFDVALVTAAVAVLVGLPAMRFGQFFTAVVTLGFAYVAQTWLFRQSWFTGNDTGYMTVDTVHVLGTPIDTARGIYAFSLAVLALVVVLLASIRRTSIGRAIIAVRDNPDRVGSDGIAPTRVKLYALALSGFVAGLAGTIWAMATRQWSFDSFDPTMSLVILAVAIVGSLSSLSGPILGAFAVFAWPFLVPDANTLVVRSLTSGALLLVVLLFTPDGLAGLIRDRMVRRFGEEQHAPRPSPPVLPARRPDVIAPTGHLHCTEVSKHFGGIVAVADATLTVGESQIVGIIGGNGAGKSTLLDCLSGRQSADHGRVQLGSADVTQWTPARRAAAGLARTYQDAALFSGLTVRETLLVAAERTNPDGLIGASVGAPWVQFAELEKLARVDDVMDSFGLLPHADRLASELSTGMRRICEIAAAVVARPSVILLDEPTSGIAQREVEAFADRIRRLRDEVGVSVLVVEHDIPMLVSLCDRLYCMEQGTIIAEGEPAEVVSDPRVIASCLGTDVAAIHRSGAGDHEPGRSPRAVANSQRTPSGRPEKIAR